MKITSHREHGHDHEAVEVISSKHVWVGYFEVLFKRDNDTQHKYVLSDWVVETTCKHDEFYEEDVTLCQANVINPESGEKLCKAELSEEEEEKVRDYISNLEF